MFKKSSIHTDKAPKQLQVDTFWELWDQHKPNIARKCYYWLDGKRDNLEDVLSDTAIKAYNWYKTGRSLQHETA